MTQTLTTERLREIAERRSPSLRWGEAEKIAAECLANREAQPVGFYTTVSGRKGVVWHNGTPEDDTAIYTAPPAPANVTPFMFAILHPDGSAWMDEGCVALDRNHLGVVLADLRRETGEDYRITPVYTAPPAPVVNPAFTRAPAVPGYISTRQAISNMENHELCGSINVAYKHGWNDFRAAMLAQPVSQGYKLVPHAYRELVNSLRDTAVKYSGTDQLRERLNTALSQFIEPDHPHTRTTAQDRN
ncbi:hypothetical protein [Serratia proteamaculans]|uniref:hypothetical protein n=1 Tax=Serratia proteamaculans TaxID=28151 RepID=UPI00101E8CBE|nr:hypothetical protein [Serratia proteamaculans]RYM50660.1 hypothetical protein BSQ97_14955 [Serratia proteamaculans]